MSKLINILLFYCLNMSASNQLIQYSNTLIIKTFLSPLWEKSKLPGHKERLIKTLQKRMYFRLGQCICSPGECILG